MDTRDRPLQNDNNSDSDESVALPINGVLDLHTFNPREIKDLLPDYLDACRAKGIYEIRVIHGKGSGVLKQTVHSILRRQRGVVSFRLAGGDAGGWGATLIQLDPE